MFVLRILLTWFHYSHQLILKYVLPDFSIALYFTALLSFHTRGTSRKFAASIPDGVTGMFQWHDPSYGTMAVGSTQPLTQMSSSSWGWRRPVCSADNPTTFTCRVSSNLGALTSWNPQGLSRDCCTFTLPLSLPYCLFTQMVCHLLSLMEWFSLLNPYRTNVENRVSS